MKIMSLISNTDAYKYILDYSLLVDQREWILDEKKAQGSLQPQDISLAQKSLEFVQQKFAEVKPSFPAQASLFCDHLDNKFNHLANKLVSLQTFGPTIPHAQFKNAAPFLSPIDPPQPAADLIVQQEPEEMPVLIAKPLSFSITEANAAKQKFFNFQILGRVSYLLRHDKEQQALQEFSSIPSSSVAKAVYAALWMIRGKPMGNHPIAHDNFGEVSFKNMEKRCASTPQQKACAVELALTSVAILETIDAFEKNNADLAYEIFKTLPSRIKNELFGKHWELMGKPTDQSPEEELRKISHPDFGKVSLLGLDPRCDVSSDKKAGVLKAYLPDYGKKVEGIQENITQIQLHWDEIDKSKAVNGSRKNIMKRSSLDDLANHIIPLFEDNALTVKPTPKINSATGQPGSSFRAMTEAYIESYPSLRPFFLQLVPDLKFAGETLIENQGATGEAPKPSQMTPPDLANLGDYGRKTYRRQIIEETLDTLQKGHYINSKGQKINLDLQSAIHSLECHIDSGMGTKRDEKYKTHLFLDKKDCLTVARECVERGLNPLVLDAASNGHFGGGYRDGAGAQEENLCRRSGLSFAADPKLSKQKQNFYPLSEQGTHAGLYVSNVPVFRGEEDLGYPYLDAPFEAAFSIMAAYNFNEPHQKKSGVQPQNIKRLMEDPQTKELRIPDAEAWETKEKLRTVLHMTQIHGHDSVVLMPIGCGAFCNPPKHICEMVMELITEEFAHSFKEIHISIIDDHNTGKAHNPRGNYLEFKEVIEKQYLHTGTLSNIGAQFN
jgi:uncharacterized protein (TIGR02452 family)